MKFILQVTLLALIGLSANAKTTVVVKFSENFNKAESLTLLGEMGESLESTIRVKSIPLTERFYRMDFQNKEDAEVAISELSIFDSIESIDYAKQYKPSLLSVLDSDFGPNNPDIKDKPSLPNEWLIDPHRGSNWNIPLNNVYRAWEYSKGENIIIAVVDTGVDYNHEDLIFNMWRNSAEDGANANNGIDDDGNGYVDDVIGWDCAENDNKPWDDYGHGTHVAGIAAAPEGNGIGVTGVAPKAQIMALRFITKSGSGSDADAAECLAYAAKMGAHIINNSWGGSRNSEILEEAFANLENSGILIVNAAGNEGLDIGVSAMYPARYQYDNLIAVAANGTQNQIFWWSNHSRTYVQMSSAGYQIHSSVPNDGYTSYSGTSMAAPQVAGAAALAWSLRPDLSVRDLRLLFKRRDQHQPTRHVNDPVNGMYTKYTQWRRFSKPGTSIKWLAEHPEYGR